MSVISSESWDGTPGSIPTNWTSSNTGILNVAHNPSALSSPGVLILTSSTPSISAACMYGVQDGNSGNVAVQAWFSGLYGLNADFAASVYARCSSATVGPLSNNGYLATCTWNSTLGGSNFQVFLQSSVSGLQTNLAVVNFTSWNMLPQQSI